MRRYIAITSVMILLLMIFTACSSAVPAAETAPETTSGEPEAAPTPTAPPAVEVSLDGIYIKPLDLYSDALNPLSDIDMPDNYQPYKLDVNINDTAGMFKLSYLTDDPEAAAFAASLINIASEDEIAGFKQALKEGGFRETGLLDNGREIEISVAAAEDQGRYYTESAAYNVQLSTHLDSDMLMTYLQIIKQNIHTTAFQTVNAQELADQLDLISGGSLTLVTGSVNYFNASATYALNDDFDRWYDYFSSDAYFMNEAVAYWGEENVSTFDYSDLTIRVYLNPDDKTVSFSQELADTEQNISAYVPSQSLVTVGFDKMGNYNSADGTVYIGIRKEVFGDIDEGDGTDLIQFSIDDGSYDCFLVKYFRPDGKYYVQIAKDGLKAEYNYDAFSEEFSDFDGDKTLSEIKESLQVMMATDADMVMIHPINTFEQYIIDTFGMNSDALYDLPKE